MACDVDKPDARRAAPRVFTLHANDTSHCDEVVGACVGALAFQVKRE
jgi:hypothetical protein